MPTESVKVAHDVATAKNVAMSYAHYLNQFSADSFNITSRGFFALASPVTTFVAAGANIAKGVRNLKKNQFIKSVTCTVNNYTSMAISLSKATCTQDAVIQGGTILPGQSLDIELGSKIGINHGLDAPMLTFRLGNSTATDYVFLEFTDMTDNTSRQIRMSHIQVHSHASATDPLKSMDNKSLATTFYEVASFSVMLPSVYIFCPPLSNGYEGNTTINFLERTVYL